LILYSHKVEAPLINLNRHPDQVLMWVKVSQSPSIAARRSAVSHPWREPLSVDPDQATGDALGTIFIIGWCSNSAS
jgi:hypothetical protein